MLVLCCQQFRLSLDCPLWEAWPCPQKQPVQLSVSERDRYNDVSSQWMQLMSFPVTFKWNRIWYFTHTQQFDLFSHLATVDRFRAQLSSSYDTLNSGVWGLGLYKVHPYFMIPDSNLRNHWSGEIPCGISNSIQKLCDLTPEQHGLQASNTYNMFCLIILYEACICVWVVWVWQRNVWLSPV